MFTYWGYKHTWSKLLPEDAESGSEAVKAGLEWPRVWVNRLVGLCHHDPLQYTPLCKRLASVQKNTYITVQYNLIVSV